MGRPHILKKKKKKNLNYKQLEKGESFGENEFFTKEARSFGAKSLAYTTLYVIYLDDFLSLVKEFDEDFVFFHFFFQIF